MTPFWAFVIGVFFSGSALGLVFGALHLESEEKAYQKGYADGLRKGCSNEADI